MTAETTTSTPEGNGQQHPPRPVAPDTHTLWAARVRVAILEDLDTAGVCTVDSLHRAGEPMNPKRWGGVFNDKAVHPLIQHSGYTRSRRKVCHGRPVSIWVLKSTAAAEVRPRLDAARAHLDSLETLHGDGDTLPLQPTTETNNDPQQETNS